MLKLLMEGKNLFNVPIYINFNTWQEFDKIAELTQSDTEDEYLIMGDFNVRV